MKKARNWSIKKVSIVMIAIPLIASIAFGALFNQSKNEELARLESFVSLANLSKASTDLIHNVQLERGMSAAYLASEGKGFQDSIEVQRTKFNQAYEILLKSDDKRIDRGVFVELKELFSKLKDVRARVQNLSISKSEVVRFYSEINSKLFKILPVIESYAPDQQIGIHLANISRVQRVKEYSGLERALLASIFSTKKLSSADQTKFYQLIASQEEFLRLLTYNMSADLQKVFVTEEYKGLVEQVNGYRGSIKGLVAKSEILSDLKLKLGYGGLIHDFQTFIIKGQKKYLKSADQRLKEVDKLLEDYLKLPGVQNIEKMKLRLIKITFRNYKSASARIQESFDKLDTAEKRFQQVRVNDSMALRALHDLDSERINADSSEWFKLASARIDHMSEISTYLYTKISERHNLLVTEVRQAFWMSLFISITILLTTLITSFVLAKVLVTKVARVSTSLDTIAKSLGNYSNQLDVSAVSLSQVANGQAQDVETTSTAAQEINAMVSSNNESASKAKDMADETRNQIEEGKKTVRGVVDSVHKIEESNRSVVSEVENSNQDLSKIIDIMSAISSKVGLINDIVFQTKLLSFNASVEAARAGEHGKGFSVVAEEIGALAQTSGVASEEITALLQNSINQVESIISTSKDRIEDIVNVGSSNINRSLEVANQSGELFARILEQINILSDLSNDIANSSEEQETGVSNITSSIYKISETSSNAQEISESVKQLSSEISDSNDELAILVDDLMALIGRNDSTMESHEESDLQATDKEDSEEPSEDEIKLVA